MRIGPAYATAGQPKALTRLGRAGASAVAAAIPELWLAWGDSLNVGIDARTGGVDLDWPNTGQVRQRAPTGLSSDISPLDQAIAPTGTDYLSSHEYFMKQRAADIATQVYIVPHGYNGSSIAVGSWGVGNTLHEAFITRANAAIQTFLATYPTGIVGGIIQFEGTNDANASVARATYEPALTSAISDMRSRIFKNGVSGTTIAAQPYIINSILPEFLAAGPTARNPIEYALREVAATITNGKFYHIPEGLNRVDNTHPTAAGMRVIGPANAALLTDTTAPVITFPITYTMYESQTFLLPLAADKYVWWTLSGAGASDFEIYAFTDNSNGIGSSRTSWYLRWASDGTKTPGTYAVTINAKDGSGNTSSQVFTVTVAAAYGTQVGTITKTSMTLTAGAPASTDLRKRALFPVSLGAGMNVIMLNKTSGATTDVLSVSFNGHLAIRDANSTGNTQIWYLPMASAQSGSLYVTPDNTNTINGMDLAIVCLTGTVAAPSSSSIIPRAVHTTPHLTASLTCPASGIIVGAGDIPAYSTPTAGATNLALSTPLFTGYRTTDGSLGGAGTNSSNSAIVAAAFAKA